MISKKQKSKSSSKLSSKLSSRQSSKKIVNDTLLKSRITKSKNTKSNNTRKTKIKKNKKQHIIDKYCGYYKTDINGKINKNLYNSCKINKYCRKYKCQDIDYKMIKAKQNNIGFNYNKIIFDKIKESCNQNRIDEDKVLFKKKNKRCEINVIENIYKDNNLHELYNKSKECDKVICAKEQKIFNQNLFRQKQLKMKKSQTKKIKKNDLKNEVDMDLIERGDL